MSSASGAFQQFQGLLREMFQFDHNELDFGLFKVLRLKQSFIEAFIDGDAGQDLKNIVADELANIRQSDEKAENDWITRYCSELGPRGKAAWDDLSVDPTDAKLQDNLKEAVTASELPERLDATLERIERWLQGQSVSSSHLEAQLYNYLLNFFDLYYQNGDFGYNSRSSAAFRVPYEAAYDGADTMFHFKHRDCYYIKTGNSFPEVALEVAGKRLVFRLEAGGDDETGAQNNNKDAAIKLYALAGVAEEEGDIVVRFQLAKTGTAKAEIYRQVMALLGPDAQIEPYLFKKAKDGEVPASAFKDLGKDHNKAEGGQIKGINQLRLTEDAYLGELAKIDHFRDLGSNADARTTALKSDATAQALLTIDRALNRFYVGQDADYFIHKDLKGFLSREKDRFIKSVIFSDLDALLSLKGDTSTRILARAFNAVAARIIEFLDATETFQRNLFTLKKKVIDTHWLISLGKIPESYWPGLLANERLRAWWKAELKQEVASIDDMRALPTLVVDTCLYESESERALIDQMLADPAFDHLDEQTDGLLIHSENWQALNLLADKFRERIQCIYIDPPYNTGGDGFLYKDSFRHSSWAAMMADRLELAKSFLAERGAIFASIDEKERGGLEHMLAETFGGENRLGELIWRNVTDNNPTRVAVEHEYIECFAANAKKMPSEWKSPLSDAKDALIKIGEELIAQHGDTPALRAAYAAWYRENKPFLGSMDGYKHIDDGGIYTGSRRVHNPGKEGYRYDVIHPLTGKACKPPLMGYRFPEETMKRLLAEDRIIFGEDETKIIEIKVYAHEFEDKLASVITLDGRSGANDLRAMFPGDTRFKNPKTSALLEGIFPFVTGEQEYVMDFFAGSGTTAQAVLALNRKDGKQRRFVLTEMGDYFNSILKPRVAKVMHSSKWKEGAPDAPGDWQGIVKVQRLEQYEDVVTNLETAWDEVAMPGGVPVRYLFRPDESRVRLSLELARPFANTIKAGREGRETVLDLLETRALLQGLWVRSRRTFNEDGKLYSALESECGCLILFRDIAEGEDDSEAVNRIVASYTDEDGSQRLARLELNHWADLRRIALPTILLSAGDFDRGAQWS